MAKSSLNFGVVALSRVFGTGELSELFESTDHPMILPPMILP